MQGPSQDDGPAGEHEPTGHGILTRGQAAAISRSNARRWALRATPGELSTWEACGREDCEYCVEVDTVRRVQATGREVGKADRRDDSRRQSDRTRAALAGRYLRASVPADVLLAEADRQDAVGDDVASTSIACACRHAARVLRALAHGEPTAGIDPRSEK